MSGIFVDRYGPTGLTIALLALSVAGSFVFAIYAAAVGENSNEWTRVDDRCWVYATQDNRVFGRDGAEQRRVFCEVSR